MSKIKENVTKKVVTPVDAIVKSHFNEMVKRLNENLEHNKDGSPLIEKLNKKEARRPLGDNWKLPPSVCFEFGTPGSGYPSHNIDSHSPPGTFIDLIERCQSLSGRHNTFIRAMVMIKPTVAAEPDFYYMSDNSYDTLDLHIIAGCVKGNPPRANIDAGGADKIVRYFEPEEFCVFTVSAEGCNRNMGIFTYFNKSKGVLFSQFVTGSPGFKNAAFTNKGLLNKRSMEFSN